MVFTRDTLEHGGQHGTFLICTIKNLSCNMNDRDMYSHMCYVVLDDIITKYPILYAQFWSVWFGLGYVTILACLNQWVSATCNQMTRTQVHLLRFLHVLHDVWELNNTLLYIDSSVQDSSISSVLAMEILQSCTKPLICAHQTQKFDIRHIAVLLVTTFFG